MPFVIRRKGTDTFLLDSARYGGLNDAYPYALAEQAFTEADLDTDEVVKVEYRVVAVVQQEPEECPQPLD